MSHSGFTALQSACTSRSKLRRHPWCSLQASSVFPAATRAHSLAQLPPHCSLIPPSRFSHGTFLATSHVALRLSKQTCRVLHSTLGDSRCCVPYQGCSSTGSMSQGLRLTSIITRPTTTNTTTTPQTDSS
eukprot:Gb_35901 [translate_table: standard]